VGYTHYWSFVAGHEQFEANWAQLVVDAQRVAEYVREQDIELAGGLGEGRPIIAERDIVVPGGWRFEKGVIWVNGPRRDDLGHESFVINPAEQPSDAFGDTDFVWVFCKTARKPYDLFVTTTLLRARMLMPDCFAIASDGSWDEEWRHGAMYWGEGCEKGLSPREVYGELWPNDVPPTADPISGDSTKGPPCVQVQPVRGTAGRRGQRRSGERRS
jgi:hypothetical protein